MLPKIAPDPNTARSVMGARPIRSILILQTKFIGDLVLSSALGANLRLEFPDARIVFLCARGFEKFVIAHGIAKDVVAIGRKRMGRSVLARIAEFYSVVRTLRGFHFDMTIDVSDSKTSRLIAGLVNAPIRVGYNPPERPLRWTERQPANVFATPYGYGEQHFLYRYLSPLQALGIALRTRAPLLRPSPREIENASALLVKHGLRAQGFVAVHAGAAFEGRRWQPERFAAVIDDIVKRRGLDVVLIGGPDERGLADAILPATNCRVVDLVGILSLETLLAVLQQARLFLGNESGPMHMAAAAGTPVVGLFGLTDPVRWGPVGVANISLRPPMPCECVAKDVCKKVDPSRAYCVRRLSVDEVIEAVGDLLNRTGERAPLAAQAQSPKA